MPVVGTTDLLEFSPQQEYNNNVTSNTSFNSNPYPNPYWKYNTRDPYSINEEVEEDDDEGLRPHSNGRNFKRNDSFGSLISGLSADDTYFESNMKTTNHQPNMHPHYPNSDKYRGHVRSKTCVPSKGRDFGRVFDHLIKEEGEFEDAEIIRRVNSNTSSSTNNTPSRTKKYYDPRIQKPTHLRTQSDITAFSRSSHHHHNPQYLKHKPAHATLRERITSGNSTLPRPQIIQDRSTSITAQSSLSSGNTDLALGNNGVWNGQPLDNLRNGNGMAVAPPIGEYSVCGKSEEEGEDITTLYRKQQKELLGNRPRRQYRPNSAASTCISGDVNEDRIHDGMNDDPLSIASGSRFNEDGRSVFSGASTTSGQRRRVVKDEIKFIMSRFVPAQLRKVLKNDKSVNLERSEEGCLT